MTGGRLIAVVGPSGVGKDSVIDGITAAYPAIRRVRRVVTRPEGSAGEAHDSASATAFAAAEASGAFCLSWHAHGLGYGLPRAALDDVRGGAVRIANLSRGALAEAARVFPALTVLHVTAAPEVLAARLAGRGRETAGEIAGRLAQAERPLPPGLDVIHLDNGGPLADTVARALDALGLAGAAP